MSLKTLILSAALSLGALSASAATINTDCGTIADGQNLNCGSFNLAMDDTQFGFDADVADGASSGSLIVDTFVNPFYSTGMAGANVLVELDFSGEYADYDDAVVTLTFGSSVANLVRVGNTFLTTEGLMAMFDEVDTVVPLTLAWSGFEGGEQISLRVAAVPLPAGLLLLGTALGGLGIARRRRKTAA